MQTITKIIGTALSTVIWSVCVLPWAGWAQTGRTFIAGPIANQPIPEALPQPREKRRLDVRREGIAPPPTSPPSILKVEVQPIDLTTALNLAGVQNPDLNVMRTRVVEAAAMRQLAAAYFLPSINPGMNYDDHTGNLQQSSGNILSVNRSAFYIGAGSNAVGSRTVTIPGVYLARGEYRRGHFRIPGGKTDRPAARIRDACGTKSNIPSSDVGL